MSRDQFIDFAALMEERGSSVSEDSSSQAEDENSRDTAALDVENVPEIHHGPVIQAIQELKTKKGKLKFVYESYEFWQYYAWKFHPIAQERRRPKDKRKKYKDADKRILKILQEYQRDERSVIELLKGIAQNIVIGDVVGIDDEIENDE
ncbi:hypothetical protein DdX_21449 [Ditylenchus destructor]|uniref:Uncharacterized protein n=1 Tax=Ditylenchus destructor TaxID=166010 RepID=A0AAD4MJ29_9BILA|nr:hypothetical protein DdX_21449 [Ditylenchus destructor]